MKQFNTNLAIQRRALFSLSMFANRDDGKRKIIAVGGKEVIEQAKQKFGTNDKIIINAGDVERKLSTIK